MHREEHREAERRGGERRLAGTTGNIRSGNAILKLNEAINEATAAATSNISDLHKTAANKFTVNVKPNHEQQQQQKQENNAQSEAEHWQPQLKAMAKTHTHIHTHVHTHAYTHVYMHIYKSETGLATGPSKFAFVQPQSAERKSKCR